jgi:hypothetical protein
MTERARQLGFLDLSPSEPASEPGPPRSKCTKREKPAPDDPRYLRTCNRCGESRNYTVGLCPECGSNEFRLPPPSATPRADDGEDEDGGPEFVGEVSTKTREIDKRIARRLLPFLARANDTEAGA